MRKTKFIALFIIGVLCLGSVKIKAENNLLNYHMSKFSTYLEKNSNSKSSLDKIVENYYKNPENKKIAQQLMKKEQNKDYSIYKTININGSDVSLLNNGAFTVNTTKENQEVSTLKDSFKIVTNNWDYKALLGNTLITHKFRAKFGYNKKKAWIVPRSAVGNAYEYFIMEIKSKDINGWDTAAHSRTARMYVVACQNFNGIKMNYMHTDTRVGVTKTGKAYVTHKVGEGI